MKLFDVVPENFFSLLASSKRELYVDALLLVQSAFKSDLVIKKSDLLALLAGGLENSILAADFTEEENENIESIDNRNEVRGLSGKSRLLLKKIQDCGWIKISADYRTKLEKLLSKQEFSVFYDVIGQILKTGKTLEQEQIIAREQ